MIRMTAPRLMSTAAEIDVDRHVPGVGTHAPKGLVACHTCVVHDDVHAAKPLFELGGDSLWRIRVRDVDEDGGSADALRHLAARRVIGGSIETHDVRALRGEQLGRSLTDASSRAGDEGNLAAKHVRLGRLFTLSRGRDVKWLAADERRPGRQEKAKHGVESLLGALLHEHTVGDRAVAADFFREASREALEASSRCRMHRLFRIRRWTTEHDDAARSIEPANPRMDELVELVKVVRCIEARAVKHDGVDARAFRGIAGRDELRSSRPSFARPDKRLDGSLGGANDQGVGAGFGQALGKHGLQRTEAAHEHLLVVERPLLVGAFGPRQFLRHRDRKAKGLDQFSRVLVFEQKIRHASSAPH